MARQSTDQYVYVRCWPGFTDSFPFEKLNLLPDDEICTTIDGMAVGWERSHVREIEKRRARGLDQLKKVYLKQSARRLGIRNANGVAVKKRVGKLFHWAFAPDGDWPRPRFRPPLVITVGFYAGWVTKWNPSEEFEGLPFGPLIWLAKVPDKAFAELLIERMREHVPAEVHNHFGPRYGHVAVTACSSKRRDSIECDIEKNRRPVNHKGGKKGLAASFAAIADKEVGLIEAMRERRAKKRATAGRSNAVKPPIDLKPTPKPHWNKARGDLLLGTRIIKHVQNVSQSTNAVKVLDSFQRDGWPEQIGDPLDAGKLRETIRSLNYKLGRIRFGGDGTGKGIRWSIL